MPDIVKVLRLDGVEEFADITPHDGLKIQPLGGSRTKLEGYISYATAERTKYYHPEMIFILEQETTVYADGKRVVHRIGHQVIEESWLIQQGYERAGTTREFAEKADISNAKFSDMFKRAIKNGKIHEGSIEFPKGTWWVRWKDGKA